MIRKLVVMASLVVVAVLAAALVPAAGGGAAEPPPPVAFAATWGSFGAADGQFKYPWGVGVDSAGNVYVADRDNHRVQKFSPSGAFLAQWGSYGTGPGQFANPYGLAVDADDHVYVVDTSNHRVQKFTAGGQFVTQWGSYGYRDGWFQYPQGVAVDRAGHVYVTDGEGRRVQKFDADGRYLTQWGSPGTGNGQFDYPRAVAVDEDGVVYVADTRNHRVQRFTADGTYLGQWGGLGTGAGQFDQPFALAVQAGRVYVADYNNHRVQVFDTDGGFLAAWGGPGSGAGQFRNPQGIHVDHAGRVLVSDAENHRVQAFVPTPGELTGTVRDTGSAAPVGGAWLVLLRTSDLAIAASTGADGAGRYRVAVPPGTYLLYVIDPTGAHQSGLHGDPTPLVIEPGGSVLADPGLDPTRGGITGTVRTATTTSPVPGAWALAFSSVDGSLEAAAVASPTGGYDLGGLAPGRHFLGWVDPGGAHATRFAGGAESLPASPPLDVVAGSDTAADGALPAQPAVGTGSLLSGRVTDAATGEGLGGVHVVALRAADYRMARGAVTASDGTYALDLADGSYLLAFADGTGTHHMAWYDGQPATGLAAATPVAAPGRADAALARSVGAVVGTVTEDGTGTPLPNVGVLVLGPTGIVAGVTTGANGRYRVDGLRPGTYRLVFADGSGAHRQEYWDGGADYASASPVAVTAGSTATLDAALARR